jgi:hypothetical protein
MGSDLRSVSGYVLCCVPVVSWIAHTHDYAQECLEDSLAAAEVLTLFVKAPASPSPDVFLCSPRCIVFVHAVVQLWRVRSLTQVRRLKGGARTWRKEYHSEED